MALVPLSHLVSRPNEHRQCQSRRPAARLAYDQWPIQRESDDFLCKLLGVRAVDKRIIEEATSEHLPTDHHALAVNYT